MLNKTGEPMIKKPTNIPIPGGGTLLVRPLGPKDWEKIGRARKAILDQAIKERIFLIRGQRVMLSNDLAPLYGVTTSVLNQAVKRNRKRFPPDFMFQLTKQEFARLRSQIVTTKWGGVRLGSVRRPPFAFTEQGVAMLSGLLNSDLAIAVNIEIMRAFVRLREILASDKDLARKFQAFERETKDQFKVVFKIIKQLGTPPDRPQKQIGFGNRPKK